MKDVPPEQSGSRVFPRHLLDNITTALLDTRVESPDGRVAAIEVKAGPGSVRNLVSLRDRLGTRFAIGVALHTGPEGAQLSERIVSLPICALWS